VLPVALPDRQKNVIDLAGLHAGVCLASDIGDRQSANHGALRTSR
jgi:hypothetical protein